MKWYSIEHIIQPAQTTLKNITPLYFLSITCALLYIEEIPLQYTTQHANTLLNELHNLDTCTVLQIISSVSQGLTKNMPNSLGLVDFPVGQADFIGHLPDSLVWLKIFMAHLTVDSKLELVQNNFRQVELKCRLPKRET